MISPESKISALTESHATRTKQTIGAYSYSHVTYDSVLVNNDE